MIFKKILEGVRALHNVNICHRGLTIENILLDDNYNPKIYDFYNSCMNMNNLQGDVGNRIYMAPEKILNQSYNGIIADIFSLGQILFNIATGINRFNSESKDDIYYRLIIEHHFLQYWQLIEKKYNLNLSQNFKNLFIRMVAHNPVHKHQQVQP